MAVGDVTVPGWVTESACRTKGERTGMLYISTDTHAVTHTRTHKGVSNT